MEIYDSNVELDEFGNLYIDKKKFIPYYAINGNIYTVSDGKIFRYLEDESGKSTLLSLNSETEQYVREIILRKIKEDREELIEHSVTNVDPYSLFVPEELSYKHTDKHMEDKKDNFDPFDLFVPEELSSAKDRDIKQVNNSFIPKEVKDKFERIMSKLPEPIRARAGTIALLTLLSAGGGILLNHIVSDLNSSKTISEKDKDSIDKAKEMLINKATDNLKVSGILDGIKDKSVMDLDFSNININDSVIEVWAYSEALSEFYPKDDVSRMTITNYIAKNIVDENGEHPYVDCNDYFIKNGFYSYNSTLKQDVILERIANEEILNAYNNGSIENILNNSKKDISSREQAKPRRKI